MLRHYLQVATHSLVRHRLYSFINIVGLSVGLTCVILATLFVRYELSYDNWIPGAQSLYRVELSEQLPNRPPLYLATAPYPLGTAMADHIPAVSAVTRLWSTTLTLTRGDRQFLQKNVDFVDSNFFRIVRLRFIDGDPGSALIQPESVVLSESAARKYFGSGNPMGRIITANVGNCPADQVTCTGDTVALRVTGVVRNLPQNTQLTGDIFLPTASLANTYSPDLRRKWFVGSYGWFTYVKLARNIGPAAILAEAPSVLDQDVTGVLHKMGIPWRGSQVFKLHLTRFARVHLRSARWQGNLTPPGSRNVIYGVIFICVLILLVACFNFTNLATACAALRAREIGVRKTLGASRRQLALQFLSEAVFLSLLALVCAVAAAEILLPALNGFLHASLALNYVQDWLLDLILVGIATGAGLLSGIYPALALSRLRPVSALKDKAGTSEASIRVRNLLVTAQFAVSIGLGIAAIVVLWQVNYMRSERLGFRRNDIVVIGNSDLTGERQEAFAQALRSIPGVRKVGLSAFVPFATRTLVANVRLPGQPSHFPLQWLPIGPDYPRTYGIALVTGRLLSASRADDRFSSTQPSGMFNDENDGHNVLVNVAAARKLGFTPQGAIDKTIWMNGIHVHIVGVLGDAAVDGAREPVAPTVYLYYPNVTMNVSVRLNPVHLGQTLASIDNIWHVFVPTVAIQRYFLSASFAELYRSDEREGTVFGVFVIISISIACLGLYGLIVFSAARHTKEVAVRKISGARTLDILMLMLWRISVPVLLGNVISWPVTYYYLHRWLQGFADHIWLSPVYFVAGGAIALAIAWVTVFLHALRLARTSPIHALRYE